MKWLIMASFILMVSNQSANIVRHEIKTPWIIRVHTPLINLKTDLDTLNSRVESLHKDLETNFIQK